MELLKYLKEQNLIHFDDIKTHLEQHQLKVKSGQNEYSDLYIVMYDQIFADFSKSFMLNCRGIILEKETNKIICYPFDKFFNQGEKYSKEVNWATVRCFEKADGSFIKAFYYNNKWNIASNGCISASDAKLACGMTVFELFITIVPNYEQWLNLLDKNYTYMFELIHPLNHIVVIYKKPELIYLGARNINDYIELSFDDLKIPYHENIRDPKTFKFDFDNPLKSILEYLKNSTWSSEEGFVVCDSNFDRVKMKSASYVTQHHNMSSIETIGNKLDYALNVILDGEEEEIIANSKQISKSGFILAEVVDTFVSIKTIVIKTFVKISKIIDKIKLENSIDDTTDQKKLKALIARGLNSLEYKLSKNEFNLGIIFYDYGQNNKMNINSIEYVKYLESVIPKHKNKFRYILLQIIENNYNN